MDLRTWIVQDHASVRTRLEQQVLTHVPRDRWRERPGDGSSVAWVLWHVARHQDVAVNAVVRGREQVLTAGGWAARVGAAGLGAGVGLSESEDRAAAELLDPDAVDAYHRAVAEETGRWLADVDLAELDRVPDAAACLQRADVAEDAYPWLYRMWDGKPVAFHVSWEDVGHGLNHLGELVAIRNMLGLSPF